MSKMSNPFVSVIIPVYNDPVRLKTCLQALEDQTYPKNLYEVIVVDNGSDESIEPIVTEFKEVPELKSSQKCVRIILLGLPKQTKASCETLRGPYAPRNKGLSLARGEVIAFTDSDCIPAQDWIERGVVRLQSVPDCGIVGGKIEMFFKDPDHPTVAELYDSIMNLNQKTYIEKMNFSATANLFTYKYIFDHVGDFERNVGMSDDKEWGQRVASFGYKLIYADDVRVAHPARYSFDQLRRRERRVVRGNARLERRNRSPVFIILNRDFLTGLLPPLVTTIRLRRSYKMTLSNQIKFLGIWVVLRYIEIQERVRIMLMLWEKPTK